MGRGIVPPLLAILAIACGAAFLLNIGALPGMATFNALSFSLGLALGWAAHRVARLPHGAAVLFGLATLILALVLIAGTRVDGVTRWLPLGPLNVQPALILSHCCSPLSPTGRAVTGGSPSCCRSC